MKQWHRTYGTRSLEYICFGGALLSDYTNLINFIQMSRLTGNLEVSRLIRHS